LYVAVTSSEARSIEDLLQEAWSLMAPKRLVDDAIGGS
jgi:hypothetical protein